MGIYNLILSNKEVIKLFYALILVFICAVIVLKTDKLFRLSSHNGIRYLRNAFFFYGLGFISRYFFVYLSEDKLISLLLFKYFFVIASFFLLCSLLQKKFESAFSSSSSLFNLNIFIFCIMSFIIVILDYFWKKLFILFFFQIIIFFLISLIVFVNYLKRRRNNKFIKFYFIAMIVGLFSWILNFLAASNFEWSPIFLIFIYALNLILFSILLYGVIKVTK